MDHPTPTQHAAWKKMSLSEKYQLLASTIRQARNLKRIGIKLRYPDASPLEIEQKLSSIWLHARP
jgi:protein-arginine kinase